MAKHSLKSFNPKKVAALDATMWEAYYAHSFFFLGWLLAALFREQFKVNSLVALRLAYYSGVAAMVFRKTGNTDRTKKYLLKYYRLLGRHALEAFDQDAAADSELEWWLIHRYPSRGSLTKSLAHNMSILYSVPPEKLMDYAQARARAMKLRDTAVHKEDREPDWKAITKHLEKSYLALSRAVGGK